MPISEDEYDHRHQTSTQTPSGMSKAELRRSNKPIMEKRRRARINHCLNELKTLILDAMKKDPARHSKLEKADILEMTVKHLQSIQRQQIAASVATDPTVIHKFKSGFHECAGEVSRFIGSMDGVENGVKQRLVAHLSSCVNGLSQISPFAQFSTLTSNNGLGTFQHTSSTNSNTLNIPLQNSSNTAPLVLPQVSFPSGDVNNNNGESARIQMPGGIQLIPSRLPTGELALLVPNSSNMPFFSTQSQFVTQSIVKPIADSSTQYEPHVQTQHLTKPQHHISAFTTVSRSKSPLPSPASTTHSDDLSMVESFKHKTPSPPIQNQVGATSTPFNQSVSSFKTLRTDIQPADFGHVTSSTSTSPELRADDLKIGYHPIPIYQHTEKAPRSYVPINKSYETMSASVDNQGLRGHWTSFRGNDVSHSTRKRPIDEGLLQIAEPLPKLKKYSSSEMVSSSQSFSSPDPSVNRSSTDCSSENSSFETTSTNTSGNSGSTSSNESMWRPW